jgi:hypothetical protein
VFFYPDNVTAILLHGSGDAAPGAAARDETVLPGA